MTTELATAEHTAPLIGVAMMNQTEARYTVERIKTHFDGARRLLVEMEEREGWRALGYTSWRECAAAEFGQSQAYLYRQLAAAKVEQALDSPIGEIPESHLRPLTKLENATEQRAAFERADALAGDGPRTAKHVQQAVDDNLAFRDAAQRFAALGWRLERYGLWYRLKGPDTDPITADSLDGLIKRLEQMESDAAPPAPLPRAPDGWVIWQNEGSATIGMRHVSGYKLIGQDARTLIQEAESVGRYLTELYEHSWHVSYDPMCPPNLHAYTAIRQDFDPIAAHDLPRLALAAWRADLFEDDLPDWPDELIDGLYLAGENVLELAGHDMPLGELYYLAGLAQPTTTTAPVEAKAIPHLPPPVEWKAALGRARALGLRLEMDATGVFHLYRLSDGQPHDERDDWPALLDLLGAIERGQLRHLCERAEACGATIDYLAHDDARVRVTPPAGHQQRPLDCDAADLLTLVTAWEGRAAPAVPTPLDRRAALLRHWRAVEAAEDQGDHAAALRASVAITLALAGDATRLALSQAEQAAQLLEAEGYSGVASVVRLLLGSEASP